MIILTTLTGRIVHNAESFQDTDDRFVHHKMDHHETWGKVLQQCS